jgi:hypothetical protein
MKIQTQSGIVYGNKRDPYMKWLQGWVDAGAWSGVQTLRDAWVRATKYEKSKGVTWYAYGWCMAFGLYQKREDMENHF